MTRRATVTEILPDGRVRVRLADASCDGCSTPCGSACKRTKPQTALLENNIGAQVGDRVECELPDAGVLILSLLFFFVPLGAGIATGAVLSAKGVAGAYLYGALAAVFWFLFAAVFATRKRVRARYAMTLFRIIPPDGAGAQK